MRKNSVFVAEDDIIKVSYSREDIFAIVAKSQNLGRVKDPNDLPEIFKSHYSLWYEEYPNDKFERFEGTEEEISGALTQYQRDLKERRDISINHLCDDIIKYLSSFEDLDESKIIAFRSDERGLLRQNLLQYSLDQQMIDYMQEMIQYVSVLGFLSSNERDRNLEAFPASLQAYEYRCLEGTRDRLQPILLDLTKVELSPLEQRLLDAHNEVIEENRIKCGYLLYLRDQSHLASAIQYVCGFEDDSRNQAKPMSFYIPMDHVWQIYKNYIADFKRVLDLMTEDKILFEIKEIEDIIDNHTDNEGFANKDWVGLCQKLEVRGISVADITIAGDKKGDHRYKWRKEKIEEVVRGLDKYKTLDIFDQFPLSELSDSLLGREVPGLVADLLINSNLIEKRLGSRMLLLLGHDAQWGKSPIQFLNSINEIGTRSNFAEANQEIVSDFDLGVIFLRGIQEDVEGELKERLETILAKVNHYQKVDETIQPYLNYLKSRNIKDITSYNLLIWGNSDAELIIRKLRDDVGGEFGKVIENGFDCLFFNPRLKDIICAFLSNLEFHQTNVSDLLGDIVHYAVIACDFELFDFVKNIFVEDNDLLTSEQKESLSYKDIVYKGLRRKDSWALDVLMSYNFSFFEEIVADFSEEDLLSLFAKDKSPNSTAVSYLVQREDMANLKKLFDFLPGRIRRALLLKKMRPSYYSCVHIAASLGLDSILDFLLSQKDVFGRNFINPNIPAVKRFTPLIVATRQGNLECVKTLLKYGADPTIRDYTDKTALYYAAKNGDEAIIRILLSEINCPSCKWSEKLGTYNAIAVGSTRENLTPLMICIKGGDIKSVMTMLELGVDLTEGKESVVEMFTTRRTETGFIASHMAAECGKGVILKELLSVTDADGKPIIDVDKAVIENRCYTALHYAAQNGHDDCLTILLQAGANIDKTTDKGFSALVLAIINGNTSSVRTLMEYGANVNLSVEFGRFGCFSPLHFAVYYNQVDVIREMALLQDDRGKFLINIDSEPGYWTSLRLATDLGYFDCVKALLETGRCFNLSFSAWHFVASKASPDYDIYKEIKNYRELKRIAGVIAEDAVSKIWQKCEKQTIFSDLDDASNYLFRSILPVNIYNRFALLYKGDLHALKLDLCIDSSNMDKPIDHVALDVISTKLAQMSEIENTSNRVKHCHIDQNLFISFFETREAIRNLILSNEGGRMQNNQNMINAQEPRIESFVSQNSQSSEIEMNLL